MIGKEIKEERPMPLSEVANILKRVAKEKELTYEQKRALEHATEFGKIGAQKAKQAIEKLGELGIPPEYAVMVINNIPYDEEDVKIMLEDLKDVKKDTYKKVADIVAEYL